MVKPVSGFSVIELMVTLMILAFLVLLGASLSIGWVHRAKVNEAKSKLQQAYGMAMAIAQRNVGGVRGTTLAAGLKLSGQDLLVCSGNPASENCTADNAVMRWKSILPSKTTMKINGSTSTIQTLALDNTGAPRNENGSIAGTAYEITCGDESETGDLR